MLLYSKNFERELTQAYDAIHFYKPSLNTDLKLVLLNIVNKKLTYLLPS